MKKSLLLSLIIPLVLVSSICMADPLDRWHWRSPLPTGNILSDVTWGNGTWVAVGRYGTVVTSPDGIAWSSEDSGTQRNLARVEFGNGIFVAAGAGGTILRSTDGSIWTPCVSGTDAGLTGLAYGSGFFVAAGSAGTLLTSPNGADWTPIDSGIIDPIYGIAYGNGKFVAYSHVEAGGWSPPPGKVLISADALTWTLSDKGTPRSPCFSRVDYAGGRFFMNTDMGRKAGGGGGASGTSCDELPLLTSSDGISWSTANGVDTSFPVAYGKGIFVGRNSLSRDGVTWARNNDLGPASIFKIKYAPEAGKFVAVGSEIFVSPDGKNWARRSTGSKASYNGITFAMSRFVAVGDGGTISVSRDGTAWSARLSGTNVPLLGIVYGRKMFVAVGTRGTILTSPNAITWTPRVSGTTENLYAVACGNGMLVAVGANDIILTSSDGLTWTQSYYNSNPRLNSNVLRTVAFGNNRFIAAGYKGSAGAYLTSPDGITWTAGSPRASTALRVGFANSKFWMSCYGSSGGNRILRVLTSQAGGNWTQASALASIGSISDANGVFFLTGPLGKGGYSLETSTDAVSWTPREAVAAHYYFKEAAFGAGTYVLVGDGGAIIQSDPVAPGP